MGDVHNELNNGLLSKAVKNALGVNTGESGVERFGETLTPTMDPWERPEWGYLRSEQWFGCHVETATAPALRLPVVGLYVIPPSRAINVVEAIIVDGDCRVGFAAGSMPIANSVTQASYAMDRRWNVSANGNARKAQLSIFSGDTDSTQPQLPWFRTMVGGIFYRPPIVITAKADNNGLSTGVAIVGVTVATAIKVSIIFRERQIFPEEA